MLKKDLPSYVELFGSLNYESADEYRSALSPAAYLTDIMDLKNWDYDPNGTGDIVDERRPDISEIPLNAENTITEIPHLDVVNRIMENRVAGIENVDDPYTILKDAKFPFNLPFNRYKTEINILLDYFKTRPLRFYHKLTSFPEIKLEAREALGFSEEQFQEFSTVVLDAELNEYYGLKNNETLDDLVLISRFRKATELSALQITELLFQNLSYEEQDNNASLRFFINSSNSITGYLVIKQDEKTKEDILFVRVVAKNGTKKDIAPPADYFERISRFIRVSRNTGLTFADLDFILMTACRGKLDKDALEIIAVVSLLQQRYDIPVEQICTFYAAIKDYGKGEQTLPEDMFNQLFNNGFTKKIDDKSLSDTELKNRQQSGLECSETEFNLIEQYLLDAGTKIDPTPQSLSLPYRIKKLSSILQISVESLFTLFMLIDKNYLMIDRFKFQLPIGFVQTIDKVSDIITIEKVTTVEEIQNILWLVQLLSVLMQWLNHNEMSVEQLEFICTENSTTEVDEVPGRIETEELLRELDGQFRPVLFNSRFFQTGITDVLSADMLFLELTNLETGIFTPNGIIRSTTTANELLPVYRNVIKEKLFIETEDYASTGLPQEELDELFRVMQNQDYIDLDSYISNDSDNILYFSNPQNAITFLPETNRASAAIIFNIMSEKAKSYARTNDNAESECEGFAEKIVVQSERQQTILFNTLEDTLNLGSDSIKILCTTVFRTSDETEQMATVRFMAPVLDAFDYEVITGTLKFHASLVTSYRRLLQFSLLAVKTDLQAQELEVLFYIEEVQNNLPEKLKLPAPFNQKIDAMYHDADNNITIFNATEYIRFSGVDYAFEARGNISELSELPTEFKTGVNAAFRDWAPIQANRQTYFFNGDQFSNANSPDTVTSTAKYWGIVHNHIAELNQVDAAYRTKDGNLYLFSGDQYVRYSNDNRDFIDESYPKNTLRNWNDENQVQLPIGIREKVDAIFLDSDSTTYFFSDVYFINSSDSNKVLKTRERWAQVINNIVDNNHVDAALVKGNITYLFSGDQFTRYSSNEYGFTDEGYPLNIKNNWNNEGIVELGGDYLTQIDAAFTGSNNFIYMFNGNTFLTNENTSGPIPVNKKWGLVRNNIIENNTVDAAFVNTGKTYVFSGDQYIRYSGQDYTTVDESYPKRIARWNDVEEIGRLPNDFNSGLTAAFTSQDNTGYFFSGNQYISSLSALPTQIKDHWALVRNNIQTNSIIDAGFLAPDGKTYLFSGDQFYRYSTTDLTIVDEAYPVKIENYWGGLPDSFRNRIDAVFVFTINGVDQTFLFSGDEYVRYSSTDYSVVDSGYPRQLGRGSNPEGRWFEPIFNASPKFGNDGNSNNDHDKYRRLTTIFTEVYNGQPRINFFYYDDRDRQNLITYVSNGNDDDNDTNDWSKRRRVSSLNIEPFTKIDAGFYGADNEIYIQSDINITTVIGDYTGITPPIPTNENWGLILNKFQDLNRVDAAYQSSNGNYYLFCDTHYIKYSGTITPENPDFYSDESYPRTIADNWINENSGIELPAVFAAQSYAIFTALDATSYVFSENTFVSSLSNQPIPINQIWGKVLNNFESLNRVDAAYVNSGISYLFSGNQYIRYSNDYSGYVDEEYPRQVQYMAVEEGIDIVKHFPDGIDAIMSGTDGASYTFAQGSYVSSNDPNSQLLINSRFGLVRNNIIETGLIDAADARSNAVMYLFSGDQYVRYSTGSRKFVDEGYPRSLINWKNHESGEIPIVASQGITAQFTDFDDTTYSFTETEYFSLDKPDVIAKTNTRWGIVKNNIQQGLAVDAAFITANGTRYLFSNDQYVKYSVDESNYVPGGFPNAQEKIIYVDEGYPKIIADNWGALPDEYRAGLDSASVFDGRTYFFKDTTYIRYSDPAHKKFDTNFPKEIIDEMSELPEFTLNEVKTFQQFKLLSKKFNDPDKSILTYFTSSKEGLDSDQQLQQLSIVTDWDSNEITFLQQGEILSATDLGDIQVLTEMDGIFEVSDLMMSMPSTLKTEMWDKIYGTIIDLQNASLMIAGQLKIVTGSSDWTGLAAEFNNKMNLEKRDALMGYLIYKMEQEIGSEWIENPRHLYEYLLIDVQMGEEAITSRIQEAIMCMQLFYHRTLLDLEDDDHETMVNVKYKLKSWWIWMKNYRVWEANRKVFVYPENYIRPELRVDKSPEFKELEEALLQGDINDDNADNSFKTYLDKYNEVSRLNVAGGYVYQRPVPNLLNTNAVDSPDLVIEKKIIMFGHSNTEPKTYYYMVGEIIEVADDTTTKVNQVISWSSWKDIGISINSDKVYPVYSFNKIFVFWVEIRERDQSVYADSVGPDKKTTQYDVVIFYSFFNSKGEWTAPQQMFDIGKYVDKLDKNIDAENKQRALFFDIRKNVDQKFYIPVLNVLNGARLYVTNPITSSNYDKDEYVFISYDVRYEAYEADNTTPVTYEFTFEGKLKSNLEFEQGQVEANERDKLEKNIQPPLEKFGMTPVDFNHWKGFHNDSFSAPWFSFNSGGGSFLLKPDYVVNAPNINDDKILFGNTWENLPDSGFTDKDINKHLFYRDDLYSNEQFYLIVDKSSLVELPIKKIPVKEIWGNRNIFDWYSDDIESATVNGDETFIVTKDKNYISYTGSSYSYIDQTIADETLKPFTLDQILGPNAKLIEPWIDIANNFDEYIKTVQRSLVWEGKFYLITTKVGGGIEYTTPTAEEFWSAVAKKLPEVADFTAIDSSSVIKENDKRRNISVSYNANVVLYDFSTGIWSLSTISKEWPGASFVQLDSMIQSSDENVYLFDTNNYAEQNTNFVSTPVKSKWGRMSNAITGIVDSAFMDNAGKVYLFSGEYYFRYANVDTKVIDKGYPKNIKEDLGIDFDEVKEVFSADKDNVSIKIKKIVTNTAFTQQLPVRSLNNKGEVVETTVEKMYLFLDIEAKITTYTWRTRWRWWGSWRRNSGNLSRRQAWWGWWWPEHYLQTSDVFDRKSVFMRFTEIKDKFLMDKNYPKLITGEWSNLPGDFNNMITGTFSDIEGIGKERQEILYTVRTLIEKTDGNEVIVNDYVKYTGRENFPKEISEEFYEIVRLTSNTAEILSQKLFVDGIDGLLSLDTQQQAELPAFEMRTDSETDIIIDEKIKTLTLKDRRKNDVVLYKPNYIESVPPSDPSLDFESVNAQYYWEIFFHAPFLIAQTFNYAQKFDQATSWYERIFDPTEKYDGVNKLFWRFLPFHSEIDENSDDLNDLRQYKKYLSDPFDPHAIAGLRQVAYRKTIVMSFIDNLIDHGDMLFRQYTRETINEARMFYVLAYELLGVKPELIGTRRLSDTNTYKQLRAQKKTLNMALIEMENLPINATIPLTGTSDLSPNGSLLDPYDYFYIPENSEFIEYWNRVDDRMQKIRYSLNIDGIKQKLPLFEPPLDVMSLVRAIGSGMGLAQALSDYNVAVPHYRFNFILAKSRELTSRVIQFGQSLLSALEKKDAEELALLRNTHEKAILKITLEIKNAQLDDSNETLSSLRLNLKSAQIREQYYDSLISTGLSGYEQSQLDLMREAQVFTNLSNAFSTAAAFGGMVPEAGPFAWHWGGHSLEALFKGLSSAANMVASNINLSGTMASILGGYHRREQDWDLQQKLASTDIESIKHQIAGAEIKVKIARLDINSTKQSAKNLESVDTFMKSKFTNVQLYRWMSGKLSGLYFQTYQMALDMAKAAEKSFQFELGYHESEVDYISAHYWDSLKKGLLAGETLQVDLDRMETAYITKNARRFEISKTVSLQQQNPLALLNLKSKRVGEFYFSEEMFDYDFPGHYSRQIKTISISFPAVAGPYENINATLTQLSHRTLIDPDKEGVAYLLKPDKNVDQPDSIRADWRTNQQIALSRGVNDAGLFQLNFQDERYLPYEGTGAVSTWRLELNGQQTAFDINTLTDVIIKIEYSALQGGEVFAADVKKLLKPSEATIMFNLSQDFSAEWNHFMENPVNGLKIKVTREMFRNMSTNNKVTELYMLYSLSEDGVNSIGNTKMLLNCIGNNENKDCIKLTPAKFAVLTDTQQLSIAMRGSTWKFKPDRNIDEFTPENITDIALICIYEKKPEF
ncbi:MAG: hemopexin repeat-containing protein [Gammaproteobacteria bacterium]